MDQADNMNAIREAAKRRMTVKIVNIHNEQTKNVMWGIKGGYTRKNFQRRLVNKHTVGVVSLYKLTDILRRKSEHFGWMVHCSRDDLSVNLKAVEFWFECAWELRSAKVPTNLCLKAHESRT